MAKYSISTNGQSRTLKAVSESSKSPKADPIADKIRELSLYDEDEDRDSSVNIVVEPGAIVNVSSKQDTEPPIIRKSKTVRIIAAVAGALVSLGFVAKAVWDAAH
jgi:hypothetical protein